MDLPIYRGMCLIMILAVGVLVNHSPKHACKSQHQTVMSDLNRYIAKTLRSVIILTDDAIKYKCIWPLASCNRYNLYNLSTPLQQVLTFFIHQSKRKGSNEG